MTRMWKQILLTAAAMVIVPLPAHAASTPTPAEQAHCRLIAKTAFALRIIHTPPDDIECYVSDLTRKYRVYRLGALHPAPPDAGPDWVESNLVGFYAIRRRDGAVVEWNNADEAPERVLSGKFKRK